MARSKDLPQEIITEILYSVPAKSIGRFRSVSKGWLSLLTHPDFIQTHQNTLDKHHLIYSNINRPALYSNPYDDHHEPILRPSDFHLDRKYNSGYYDVQDLILCGSCNGLVLVSADNPDGTNTFVLFNPTTKESMKLPEYFDDSNLEGYEFYELDIMAGLGYDSETGDFKVVSITCLHDTIPMTDASTFVHVYSLKTNTWRQLITDSVDDYSFIYIPSKQKGVFVNDFLHWIATKTVNGLGQTVILAFSLADEKFSEVPSPPFVKSTIILASCCCQLVVLGGKLALFHEMTGEIWLMNEHRIKESWTKILLHGIRKIPMVKPDWKNKPMVFCHDGKFMVANSDRMMVYDDEKEAFEETVCVWDPKHFKVTGSYVESLVSIDSCIEQ